MVPKHGSRFLGFPAVSLPGRQFLSDLVTKPFDLTTFSGMEGIEKFFFPGFPCAAGKRRAVSA
jgi:hypothetical protein